MEETTARGVIEIEARDEGALASLRRLDAEFDRTMHRLDGQEAEVRIKGNLSDLRRSLKEAEAEVKAHNAKIEALEERRANAVGGKKGALTREINQRKEIVSQLNEELTRSKKLEDSASKHYESLRRTNQERGVAAGRERAIEQAIKRKADAEAKYIQMEQRAASDRFRSIQAEATRRASLQRQRDQEFARAEAAAHAMDVNRDREKVKILQLQREYAKLTDRAEALGKKNVFSKEAHAKLRLDTAEVYAKMEATKAALNRLGARPPVDIKVDLDRRGLGRVKGFFADVFGKIGDFAGNIPNMAVRLGPFTTSMKGLVAIMGILGPTLVDVAGALTSLVGVLGTGLTGAAAVAGGTIAGLGLNLIGVKEALNPMIGDFKIATQTTLAYHKAVLKYGKGSDQAKTAQEQMNNAIKGMDPRARAASQSIAHLGVSWQKLTHDQANKSFLDVVNQASRTMGKLQPTLANNTNRTFQILDERITAMLTHLRSPGAIKIFDSLGRSANNFLNPALDGLQHLGAFLGRVAESAARLFAGPLGNAFKNWARDLDAAYPAGRKLDGMVTRLGQHARDLGRFFVSLGRLLITVLNGSADAGDGLLNSMTKTMDGWTKFLRSTQGHKDMGDFFNRAADGARTLYHTFGPLIAEFVRWASYLSPFVTGFLKGVNAIGKFIGKIVALTHLGGSISTFASTLGALWAVGRLGSFLAMITRVIAAVKELGVVTSVTSALTGSFGAKAAAAGVGLRGAARSAERTAAGTAERAAASNIILPPGAARDAEQAASSAGKAASKFERFKGAANGASYALLGVSAATLGVVAAGVGLGVGLGALMNHLNGGKTALERYRDTLFAGIKTTREANHAYNDQRTSLNTVGGALQHSKLDLKQTREELAKTKKGTLEHRVALLNYRDALRANNENQREFNDLSKAMERSTSAQVKGATAAYKAWQKAGGPEAIRSARQRLAADRAAGASTKKLAEDQSVLNAALARANPIIANYEGALNRQAAAQFNARRALEGMDLLVGKAEQAMGKLARTAGGKEIAAKINLKVEDPNKAGRVASQARAALQSGVGKGAVMKIVADSRSADQAIARLRAARITPKKLTILESGGAHAVNVLEAIIGRKLVGKELKIAQHGGPAVISLLEAIVGHKLPPKVQPIGQRGAQVVLGFLGRIGTFKLGAATKNILQAGGNAVLSFMEHLLNMNNLGRAVKTIVTNLVTTHSKHAEGGMETPATKRLYDRAAGKQMIRATGGKFRSPTYIVGEEDKTEYIIATNPAYRKRNREYLTMAAGELGMEVVPGYAGGGAHAAGKHKKKPGGATKRHNRGPKTGSTKRLPLTSTDTTTSDFLSQYRANEVNAYNKVAGKINSDDKQLESLSHQYADTDSGRKGAHQRQSITRKIGRLRRERAGLMKRIPQLRKNRNAAIKAYQQGADLQNLIDTDTTAMNTAATWYNNGDPMHGGVDQMAAWKKAKGDRETQLGNLKTLYEHIQKIAPPRFQTDITKTLGGIADDMASSQTEDAPTGPEPAAKPTLEDFISDQGLTDILTGLQTAYSLAQTNNVPDDPTTIYKNENADALADDLTAAGNLRDFYTSLLNTAQATGQSNDIIKDAADALVGARGDYQGIADTISGAASSTTTIAAQGMILSSARQDLFTNYGSNFAPTWAQPDTPPRLARPLPGPGPYGSNPSGTGVGGTGGTVINQTNHFAAPPPDPHTWSKGVAWELQSAV